MTQRPLAPSHQAAPRGSNPRCAGAWARRRAGVRCAGGWAGEAGEEVGREEAGATRLPVCRVRVGEAVQEGEAIDEAVAAVEGAGGAVLRRGIVLHGHAAWAQGSGGAGGGGGGGGGGWRGAGEEVSPLDPTS